MTTTQTTHGCTTGDEVARPKTVHIPDLLHRALKTEASARGLSLNAYVAGLLADRKAVGIGTPGESSRKRGGPKRAKGGGNA